MESYDDYCEHMNGGGDGVFSNVLDSLSEMRWHGLMLDMEANEMTLKSFRTWLSAEWYEKVLLDEEYPEFTFIDDDMMILDMQHELLATLN